MTLYITLVGKDFPYDRRTGVVLPRDADRLCFYFNITDDDIGGEPNEVFQVTFNITSNSSVAFTDCSITNISIIDDDSKYSCEFCHNSLAHIVKKCYWYALYISYISLLIGHFSLSFEGY